MPKDKQTALVTGGAGFIGSHLCERLLEDGYKVISLDNYFTGTKDNHISGVDYRNGHTKDIAKHIPENLDVIYHLGEYSRVAQSIKEPAVVWDLNMEGTFGVLEFWRERKIKLVYAGSSTKMAIPRPDGTAGRDLSPYTWSKAANTELVHNYSYWYGLPYSVAYFYNVYGPRERPGEYGTVIEIFKQRYLKGSPLKVNLPGTQERIYTHVQDTVEGLILVGKKGENDEYSIVSDKSYQILKVAELFGGEIIKLPSRSTSRPKSSLDTNADKIKSLGWKQIHSLEDYIKDIKKIK